MTDMEAAQTPRVGAPLHPIYSCGGGSGVGQVADRVARRLAREGLGRMRCPPAFVGNLADAARLARHAGQIVAGAECRNDLAGKMLNDVGRGNVKHVRVTNLDVVKGRGPAIAVRINKVLEKPKPELRRSA